MIGPLVAIDYYDGNYLSSTEVIPLSNGTPRYSGNLNIERFAFGLTTIGNQFQKVLAFGGYSFYNGKNYYYDSVEEWNEDTETWTLAPFSMQEKKSSFGYLTVPQSVVCSSAK